MLALIILTLVAVLTYTVEITFGLAGTVLMLPLLSFWFDSKTLVVYSVMPQIMTAGIALSRSHRHIEPRIVASMMATAVVGAFIGLWLFHIAPLNIFRGYRKNKHPFPEKPLPPPPTRNRPATTNHCPMRRPCREKTGKAWP